MRSRLNMLGRVLFVAGVLFATIVPVLFVADVISYLPLVTVVLFALFDVVYLQVLGRTLAVDVDAGLSEGASLVCERGSEAGIVVRMRNTGVLVYPRIEVNFFITDLFGDYASELSHSTTLPPRAVRELPMDARFRHLGRYTAGVNRVVVYDLIGFLSKTIEGPLERSVSVMPRVIDLDAVPLSNASPNESAVASKPIVTDDMDYAGVREYRFGDPLKTVHWKLSSRVPGSGLYTRLFEVYGNPGLETIIDPVAPAYDAEKLMDAYDAVMEAALSVNLYAREQGMDAELAFIDRDGEPASTQIADMKRFDALVERAKRIEPASESTDPDAALRLLQQEANNSRGMANIAYCTARLTPEIVLALCTVRGKRRHPMLFLAVPRSLEGDERKEYLAPLRQLDDAKIPYYIVESTEQATEVAGL